MKVKYCSIWSEKALHQHGKTNLYLISFKSNSSKINKYAKRRRVECIVQLSQLYAFRIEISLWSHIGRYAGMLLPSTSSTIRRSFECPPLPGHCKQPSHKFNSKFPEYYSIAISFVLQCRRTYICERNTYCRLADADTRHTYKQNDPFLWIIKWNGESALKDTSKQFWCQKQFPCHWQQYIFHRVVRVVWDVECLSTLDQLFISR